MLTNLEDRVDINDTVARNLRHYIKLRRLRKGVVAAHIGITRQTLYDMLRGNCRVSLEKLEKFAEILRVDVVHLLAPPVDEEPENGKLGGKNLAEE